MNMHTFHETSAVSAARPTVVTDQSAFVVRIGGDVVGV